MFPTHKDCRNFRNGLCTLLGVPLNPDGPACPRFLAKNVPPSPLPQQPLVAYVLPSSRIHKAETPKVSVTDLKKRLDKAEAKIRKIKAILQCVK